MSNKVEEREQVQNSTEIQALKVVKQALDLIVTKGGVLDNIEQVSLISNSFNTVARIVITSMDKATQVKEEPYSDEKMVKPGPVKKSK